MMFSGGYPGHPKGHPNEEQTEEMEKKYYVYTVTFNKLYRENASFKLSDAYDDDIFIIGSENPDSTPEEALKTIEDDYGDSLVYIAVCKDWDCKNAILEKHHYMMN